MRVILIYVTNIIVDCSFPFLSLSTYSIISREDNKENINVDSLLCEKKYWRYANRLFSFQHVCRVAESPLDCGCLRVCRKRKKKKIYTIREYNEDTESLYID